MKEDMPDANIEPAEFDAILLAGDRGAYKAVYGENKAFLEIEGVPVIMYVLSALQQSRSVSRVFVVGPRERISRTLQEHGKRMGIRKEVIVLEQVETMLENVRMAFSAALQEEGREGGSALDEDKTVLVLSSDLPLLTGAELDEFIRKSDLSRYDYIAGMTSEGTLKPYYPPSDGSGPGVHFAYFCFSETRERQNNLHMVRVLRVLNERLIQKMYQFRYQKRWLNILRLLWDLLKEPEVTFRVVFKFVILHLCRVLDRWKGGMLEKLQHVFRRALIKAEIEKDVSRIIKARFGSVLTTFGGAALDVDNEQDFQVIKQRYRVWMERQTARIGDGNTVEDPSMKSFHRNPGGQEGNDA